jgi:hypothetical protein
MTGFPSSSKLNPTEDFDDDDQESDDRLPPSPLGIRINDICTTTEFLNSLGCDSKSKSS